jgi:hypothetical protein
MSIRFSYLEVVRLDPTEYFSCLYWPFGRNKEDTHQKVNFLSSFDSLKSPEQEGLVHEIGEVSDGWDTVAIEAIHCHFFQEEV